mgnify:FL=1
MTNLFKREEVQRALAHPEEDEPKEGPSNISTEDVGPPIRNNESGEDSNNATQ